MDLERYRNNPSERHRAEDILGLIPEVPGAALDVGARDGHFSVRLAERFPSVVAIDLERPRFQHDKVLCEAGDVTRLRFDDNAFGFVLCAEVLEHIPTEKLSTACDELARVSAGYLLIGVPYRQDPRHGRTTCYSCGRKNPPWGHVNIFDEARLRALFPSLAVEKVTFVGETRDASNLISMWLMDLGGNPWGTYDQDEPCIHCGQALIPPPKRSILQKIFTRMASYARLIPPGRGTGHPTWIHILFSKPVAG